MKTTREGRHVVCAFYFYTYEKLLGSSEILSNLILHAFYSLALPLRIIEGHERQ